jgi:hypothetical protein
MLAYILIYTNVFLASRQVKEDEIGRAYSINDGKRNAYRILVGNPEGKRPL